MHDSLAKCVIGITKNPKEIPEFNFSHFNISNNFVIFHVKRNHEKNNSTFRLEVLSLAIKVCGLPRWCNVKESTCQCRRCGFDPLVRKIPWSGKSQPVPVFLHGKFLG